VSDTIARRYLVSGRVQGVGFRHFTVVQARKLGLTGTVANLADGRVEIEAAGGSEALDELERQVRKGPGGARVRDVEREELAGAGGDGFEVVYK
jgi:acylphosphatase